MLGLAMKEKLRLFLRGLGARRRAQGANGDDPEFLWRFPSEQLEYWSAQAVDAYTLEDALYWHSAVVRQLENEMRIVREKPWPQPLKVSTLAGLEACHLESALIVDRLRRLIARGEGMIWWI